MNWKKVYEKGFLACLTFAVSYLAANPETVLQFIPENIQMMTIGTAVAGILGASANWLKHRKD